MEINFSRHAKNRMRRFKIEPEKVLETIKNPSILTESIKNRKNAWKKYNDHWLCVTYTLAEAGPIVIITVTSKRKTSGGGDDDEN